MNLASCAVYCPGFDKNDYSLISYRLGDSLIYVSNRNDTLKFTVQEFYTKGSYKDHGIWMDYLCNSDTYYQTNCIDGISIKEHLEEWQQSSIQFSNDRKYDVFPQGDFEMEEVKDTVYRGVDCRVYSCRDLTNKRRISYFKKMEYRGIIVFYDKSTNLTWYLIE